MADKIRAYHFDLKRAMWRRDYMDRMVDRLASWGFNTIVYEIEDKFRFSKHPAIAHPAVMEGAVKERADALLARLQSLRHATRTLFAETYEPASVEEELDLRRRFAEAWLRRHAPRS